MVLVGFELVLWICCVFGVMECYNKVLVHLGVFRVFVGRRLCFVLGLWFRFFLVFMGCLGVGWFGWS